MSQTPSAGAAALAPLIPATARGEATRRKLISAAEEEFGSKGFHLASVSSVTQRAGVGQGTFYLYFHTKEEIFKTLVREIGHALRKQVAESMAPHKNRLHAERAGLDSFLQFAESRPGLYRIVQEAQFVDEPVFREYYERIARGYTLGLAAAVGTGEISAGDAELRAWSLMGIGHFLGMRYCLWDGKRPDGAAMDQVMDFISHGLAPRAKNKK